jgi:retinol dehydrogenase 12
LKRATVYSLHPGVVSTSFGSNFTGFFKFGWSLMKPFTITPEKGAQTTIFLATTAIENLKGLNGKYFNRSKPYPVTHKDITDENIDKFWSLSKEFSKF